MEKITHIQFFKKNGNPLPCLRVEQRELAPPGQLGNDQGVKDTFTLKGTIYKLEPPVRRSVTDLIPDVNIFGNIVCEDGSQFRCGFSWLWLGDMTDGQWNYSFSVDFKVINQRSGPTKTKPTGKKIFVAEVIQHEDGRLVLKTVSEPGNNSCVVGSYILTFTAKTAERAAELIREDFTSTLNAIKTL